MVLLNGIEKHLEFVRNIVNYIIYFLLDFLDNFFFVDFLRIDFLTTLGFFIVLFGFLVDFIGFLVDFIGFLDDLYAFPDEPPPVLGRPKCPKPFTPLRFKPPGSTVVGMANG